MSCVHFALLLQLENMPFPHCMCVCYFVHRFVYLYLLYGSHIFVIAVSVPLFKFQGQSSELNATKRELDYLFVLQTTHHVYEALWQRGDTDYTDVQDRPVPPAPYSNGQTHVQ